MPITKDVAGKIEYVRKADKWSSDFTGVFGDADFAVSDELDPTKQILFDATPLGSNAKILFKAAGVTPNTTVTITLPTTDTTISNGGGSVTLQPITGTSPVGDVFTFTSADGNVTIAGDSITDTLDFGLSSTVRVGGTATSGGTLALRESASVPSLSFHDNTGVRQAQIDRSTTLGFVFRSTAGVFSFMDAYTGSTRLWTVENGAIYCRFNNGSIGTFSISNSFTMLNGGSGAAGSGQVQVVGIDSGGAGLGGDVLIQSSTGGTAAKVRILSGTTGTEKFRADNTGIGFFAVTPVARQTGGAATAGAVYTSTEQTMLNAVYGAMRNYGLLT